MADAAEIPVLKYSNILHHTSVFGNSPWDILHNGEADNPFFTSDYPAAIQVVDLNTPINRIVPLAPDLAIRIKPDIRLSGTTSLLQNSMGRRAGRGVQKLSASTGS